MIFPSKINICGVPYAVKFVEDTFSADAHHFGEIRYGKAEIKINKDMPQELQLQTLIHEWLHGARVMIGRNDLTEDDTLIQSLAVAISNTFELKGEQNI